MRAAFHTYIYHSACVCGRVRVRWPGPRGCCLCLYAQLNRDNAHVLLCQPFVVRRQQRTKQTEPTEMRGCCMFTISPRHSCRDRRIYNKLLSTPATEHGFDGGTERHKHGICVTARPAHNFDVIARNCDCERQAYTGHLYIK